MPGDSRRRDRAAVKLTDEQAVQVSKVTDRRREEHVDVEKSTLHRATSQGDEDEVLRLIRLGISASKTDEYGCTALHVAASSAQVGLLGVLLQARAGILARDYEGRTALHLASSAACVERLCDLGARTDVRSLDGTSPLHVMLRNSRWEAVDALLARRADASACDTRGRSSLHFAAAASSGQGMQRLLVEPSSKLKALVAKADDWGRTPLHAAASRKAAIALLDSGASVNVRDIGGRLPLASVAARGHAGVASALLQRRSSVASEDSSSSTALHIAASHGHADVIRLLLEHSAKIDSIDGSGLTALHVALRAGQAKAAEELLHQRASATRPSTSGRHPLAFAVIGGNLEMLGILLAAKADAGAKDSDGLTALELGRRWSLVGVDKYLMQTSNQT